MARCGDRQGDAGPRLGPYPSRDNAGHDLLPRLVQPRVADFARSGREAIPAREHPPDDGTYGNHRRQHVGQNRVAAQRRAGPVHAAIRILHCGRKGGNSPCGRSALLHRRRTGPAQRTLVVRGRDDADGRTGQKRPGRQAGAGSHRRTGPHDQSGRRKGDRERCPRISGRLRSPFARDHPLQRHRGSVLQAEGKRLLGNERGGEDHAEKHQRFHRLLARGGHDGRSSARSDPDRPYSGHRPGDPPANRTQRRTQKQPMAAAVRHSLHERYEKQIRNRL